MGAKPRGGLAAQSPRTRRQAISTPEDRYRRQPHQDDQYTTRTQPLAGDPAAAGGPPYDPDLEPATQGDVRNLKRWLWVSLVWAVAASAIALMALLSDDTGDDDADRSSASSRQVQRLDERIDEVDQKLDGRAADEQVEELNGRVDELEEQIEAAGDDDGPSQAEVDELGTELGELEARVEELESQPPPEDDTAP